MRIARAVRIPVKFVFDESFGRELSSEFLVEGDHIQRVGNIQPAPDTSGNAKCLFTPQVLELIVHLGEAERRSDCHKKGDISFLAQIAEHIVRDHGTLTVGYHDEGPASDQNAVKEAFAHRFAALADKEILVHVAQQSAGDALSYPFPKEGWKRQYLL